MLLQVSETIAVLGSGDQQIGTSGGPYSGKPARLQEQAGDGGQTHRGDLPLVLEVPLADPGEHCSEIRSKLTLTSPEVLDPSVLSQEVSTVGGQRGTHHIHPEGSTGSWAIAQGFLEKIPISR